MGFLQPQDAEDKMSQAFGCLVIGVVIAFIVGIALLIKGV